MRHPTRIRQLLAAAAATLALLASACASEAPQPRVVPTTTVAPELPPSTVAAAEAPSACDDPEAEALGDGLFERNGRVYAMTDSGCLFRPNRPDDASADAPIGAPPADQAEDVEAPQEDQAEDVESSSLAGVSEDGEWTDFPAAPEPAATTTTTTVLVTTTTQAPTTTVPATTTTTVPATTTTVQAPTTTVPATTTTAPQAPEPEPAPCPEGQHRHDGEPCHSDTPEPEPEPEPSPEPEMPICVWLAVLDTPCIDDDGNEQSVLSQQNLAWGGTYLDAGDRWFTDATSTIGNHRRDHDVNTHVVTVYDRDLPMSALRNPDVLAAVHPPARGHQPASLVGHRHGHLPAFTPAVQSWSDWCFFDLEVNIVWPEDFDWPFEIPPPADSTYWCAEELHAMSFHLSHLGASEECILPRATAKMEATEQTVQAWFAPSDSPEGQAARETNSRTSYLHCPNVIYPDPTTVLTPAEHYEVLVRYAGRGVVPFPSFVTNAQGQAGGDPSQRIWRFEVINTIPNFTLGVS